MWELKITRRALEDLRKLPRDISERIIDKLEFYAVQENPLYFAKRLQNSRIGTYRFRIGDYRAIFDIDIDGIIKIILVLEVKHRKEIYRI